MKFAASVALAGLIGLGAAASANAMTIAPMPAATQASPMIEKTAVIVTKRIVRRPIIRRRVVVRKIIR